MSISNKPPLLDLPDRAVKDGEGRTLAHILTPREFLPEIE
jgi:hypothetical protein